MASLKRSNSVSSRRAISASGDPVFTEAELRTLESTHAEGMSVQQIVDAHTSRGGRLTEATFRKYVQLGLLPRSRRVGRKGKNRGSQGLYPATAVRQIAHIRRLMARGHTMEEIQRDFLFVRGDIDALERQLDRVFEAITSALDEGRAERSVTPGDDLDVRDALDEAVQMRRGLVTKLEWIERQLMSRARMASAAV